MINKHTGKTFNAEKVKNVPGRTWFDKMSKAAQEKYMQLQKKRLQAYGQEASQRDES